MKWPVFVFCLLMSFAWCFANTASANSYSAEKANQQFEAGKQLYLKGDLLAAADKFKASLHHWPVHKNAWHWLTATYQHLKHNKKYWHALFFRERTAWALDVDLRHARRIFFDIARGKTEPARADDSYKKTAQDLVVFYDYAICRVQVAREAELAKKLSFNQEYGLERLFGLTPDPNKRKC